MLGNMKRTEMGSIAEDSAHTVLGVHLFYGILGRVPWRKGGVKYRLVYVR